MLETHHVVQINHEVILSVYCEAISTNGTDTSYSYVNRQSIANKRVNAFGINHAPLYGELNECGE